MPTSYICAHRVLLFIIFRNITTLYRLQFIPTHFQSFSRGRPHYNSFGLGPFQCISIHFHFHEVCLIFSSFFESRQEGLRCYPMHFFNSHRSKQYWVHCKCERTKSKQLFLVRVHGIVSHDPRDSSRTFVFKKRVSEDGEDPKWASNFCQSHTASSCGEFVLLELDVCEGPI